MTKDEFINKLKDKLNILNEDEVEDIISEYSEHIDEKIKSGVNETDATSEFGDIDELVAGILDAYKINKNYNKGQSNFVNDIVNTTKEVFDKTIKIFSNGNFKDIIQLLIYILIALLICAIVKIPFYLLQDGFENIISPIPYKFYTIISTIVGVVINLVYVVVAYIVFIKIMNEKILGSFNVSVSESKVKSKNKNTKKDKDEVKELRKGNKKERLYKEDNSFMTFVGKLILFGFKIVAFFILIGMACGLVTSSVLFAMSIEFSIKYYLFLGIIIASLGLLVGFIWICELLYRFIFSLKFNTLRLLITFIASIVLFGVGIGVFMIEVTDLDFSDAEIEYVLRKDYQINVTDVKEIRCDSCGSVDKKINEDIEDNIINVKVYGSDYSNPYYTTNQYNETSIISFHYMNSTNKFINTILNDIKKGKFYNYDSLINLKIEIEGNKKTLNKLDITECSWCN